MNLSRFRGLSAGILGFAAALGLHAGPTAQPALAQAKAKVAMLELEGSLHERPSDLAWLSGGKGERTIRDLTAAFDDAAGQADLAGVVIRLKDATFTPSQIEEIGKAMDRCRKAGKKIHLFAEGYTTTDLLLGGHCDELILQQGGGVSMPGMLMEEMFLADTLAWVGLKADMVQVGAYKGASEQMANSKPSKEWDQNINALLDSMYAGVRTQLKAGRKMDDAKLDAAMSELWMGLGEDAKRLGMVDTLLDLPELNAHLEKTYGKPVSWGKKNELLGGEAESANPFGGMNMMNPLGMFAKLMEEPDHKPTRNTIALVYIDGAIVDGDSGGGGLFGGGNSVGSRTIRRALTEIEDNDLVKGVIIRINSPGGSAIASEVIWQGVRRVAAKKPVWVSVGGMAASGGYYILSAGDKVYVNPSSIVGSIGVVGGKIALGGLMDTLKVRVYPRARGPRAMMNSGNAVWTEEERAYVKKRMTDVYDLFTRRVTAGRKGIDLAKTAEGRLFVGNDAVGLKMADQVGGIDDCIGDLAKSLSLSDGNYDVMDYPGPKSLEDFFKDLMGGLGASTKVRGGGVAVALNDLTGVAQEVLGDSAWASIRDSLTALTQLRKEPVLLISPSTIIIK